MRETQATVESLVGETIEAVEVIGDGVVWLTTSTGRIIAFGVHNRPTYPILVVYERKPRACCDSCGETQR